LIGTSPSGLEPLPLIATQFQVPVAAASQVLDAHGRGESVIGRETLTQPLIDRAHRTLLEYLSAVQQRDVQYETRRASIKGDWASQRRAGRRRR
jgi:hypothetical protein